MKVLRLANVQDKTGLARSTLHKYIDADTSPPQIYLGGRAVVWIESEVHEWLQEKQIERDMTHGAPRGWGL
jgi:prophage regulatory protein